MFESYDLSALCSGTVIVYRPFMKVIVNGKTSYQLTEIKRYNTVLYHGQFSFVDILHDKVVLDNKDDESIEQNYKDGEDYYYADPSSLNTLSRDKKVLKHGFKRVVKLPFYKYMYEK